MQTFDIVRKNNVQKSFRNELVIGTYDLNLSHYEEHFKGTFELPEKWNVGLIVGKSGTGKTTIAKEIFKENYIDKIEWDNNKSIVDNFPENQSFENITNKLCAVGLSSPPLWIKKYSMLSNGEKMRCDLARCLCDENEMFVFDEFTSVVDRQVAQVCSLATQKAVRKDNKKFIAVTCHNDVQQFLMPDWIFNTDNMTFQILNFEEQKKNRPKFNLSIFELSKDKRKFYWNFFRKYHYLNSELISGAKCFVCFCNDNLCGFFSAIKFPTVNGTYTLRSHRFVIFPDYQCIGIGSVFINFCAKYLFKQYHKKLYTTTSNPNLIRHFFKSTNYKLKHKGLKKCTRKMQKNRRYTYTFQFIPDAD